MTSEPTYPPSVPLSPDWRPDTVAVQAGKPARVPGAPMTPPLTLSSTYVHSSDLAYGRDGNAVWGALEEALGALDGGHATVFASGLAAATAIADLVPAHGTVVLSTATYFGVRVIFDRIREQRGLEVRMVDADDTDAVIAASRGADMVWMESISNPLMIVADVPAIADAVREHGAIFVVDATFATPLRQRPIALGADIVLHSATKGIGGHSDLLLGAVICRDAERSRFFWQHRHDHGAVPGNLEAYLALRGLRTLDVRVQRAESNAGEIAARLQRHPAVTKVNYPGLPGDTQHERATRVLRDGCGTMLSFEVAGTAERTEAFLARLRLLTHATSLGGVESKIERRARWEGEAASVPPTLCRMSVGIENVEDIWNDLAAALDAS